MQRTLSLWRIARSFVLALTCVASSSFVQASDSFDPATRQLTIQAAVIGGALYSNLIVKAGNIVSGPVGFTDNGSEDSYNPANGQLTVPCVFVGGRRYYNVVVLVDSLLSVGGVDWADSYDGVHLTIPAVQVGGAIYNNVVVTVASVLRVDSGMPKNGLDTYDTASGQLTIPAVVVGGRVYTNVVIKVGNVITLGGSVTGIAAIAGGPVAGAVVTLKDDAGHSATATTAADGSFTFNVSKLRPPYLLSVPAGGTTLYSFASGPAVANLNAYTTLVLQSYYSAAGTSLAAVFGGTPYAARFPGVAQLALLVQPVSTLLQPYLASAGVSITRPFNPFTAAFAANHTGFDQVLDRTQLSGALGLSVDNGSGSAAGPISTTVAVQVSAGNDFPLTPALAVAAVNTTTVNSNAGTRTSSQQAVPVGVNAGQQGALAAAQASVLQEWQAIIQLALARGSALSAGDLLPYYDANYLNAGRNAATDAAKLAGNLAGLPAGTSVTPTIVRVNQFSLASQTLDATFALTIVNGAATQVGYVDEQDNAGYGAVFRRQANGSWLAYGHQNPYKQNLRLQAQRSYDANSGTPDTPSNNAQFQVQVDTPTGALSGATVSGPADSLPDCSQNPSVFTLSSVALVLGSTTGSQDQYGLLSCQNPLSGAPVAGTQYTFGLTPAGGGPVVQETYPLNGISLDYGDITQINGQARSAFAAGSTVTSVAGTTLTVSFTPPTTFPVLYSFMGGFCQNASQLSGGGTNLSNHGNNGPGATSGTIAIPAQCSGAAPAAIGVSVNFIGINGETTLLQQLLHR